MHLSFVLACVSGDKMRQAKGVSKILRVFSQQAHMLTTRKAPDLRRDITVR
jgi:hypothetical protein